MGEEFSESATLEGAPAEARNDIPAEHVPPAEPQGEALSAAGVVDGGESADKDRPKRGRPAKAKTESASTSEGDNTDAGGKPENHLAETPVAENEPLNPSGKVCIRHNGMAGKKIFLRRGEIGTFDNEGVLEVEIAEAERLLTIPGYERA